MENRLLKLLAQQYLELKVRDSELELKNSNDPEKFRLNYEKTQYLKLQRGYSKRSQLHLLPLEVEILKAKLSESELKRFSDLLKVGMEY